MTVKELREALESLDDDILLEVCDDTGPIAEVKTAGYNEEDGIFEIVIPTK